MKISIVISNNRRVDYNVKRFVHFFENWEAANISTFYRFVADFTLFFCGFNTILDTVKPTYFKRVSISTTDIEIEKLEVHKLIHFLYFK